MENSVKFTTSHIHEMGAEIQKRVLGGYILDTRPAFCLKRIGSAYVANFIPTRESLPFEVSDEQLTIQQKWQIDEDLDAEFDKLLEQSEPLPKELLDRMQDLRDKAEANREKDSGIFDGLVESIESAQDNPEGCVSTIVEVDKEQVRVYSKEELENMEWSEFKKLIDTAGIRGRRRQNLTRDYLIYQEENLK